jgi:hypothetical protein
MAELATKGVREVAVVGIAELERQAREIRLPVAQPLQGQAEPQAVEVPTQREPDHTAEASTEVEGRAA